MHNCSLAVNTEAILLPLFCPLRLISAAVRWNFALFKYFLLVYDINASSGIDRNIYMYLHLNVASDFYNVIAYSTDLFIRFKK